MPVGGLEQEVLAAYVTGPTDVTIPERDRAHLDDVPSEVRDRMSFHPVMTVEKALDPRPYTRSG